jgi:ubiquinone/menaquinone biosynthesis C-methylase UbiE
VNNLLTNLLQPRAPGSPFQRQVAGRREAVRQRFERLAPERDRWRANSDYYYRTIEELVRFLSREGASVLEVGCGTGDLLAAVKPARGVGLDVSGAMIERARAKHPQLTFVEGDVETCDLALLGEEPFDFVVLSDLVGYVDDVWLVFRRLQQVCHPGTRLIVTAHNALWEPVLGLAEKLGRKMPTPLASWLGQDDIANLLHLNHFEVVSQGARLLMPVRVPGVSSFVNRYLASLPLVRSLNLIQYTVARPTWREEPPRPRPLSTSIIVPTRDERGNVADIFARTPNLGPDTELIFVDGNSTDGTIEEIQRLLPTRNAKLIHQTGKGKGNAVREAYEVASNDIYMILDSDLTVPPEDLPKFYLAIAEGRGEFINGTRLVYPMEDEAMRFLNKLGNKFFSLLLSEILGQYLKDTLCGTKVLSADHYERIKQGRAFFGDFDPFGDFDLIFGAAKQQLKIVEVPIRYRARTYGDIKISRFQHGLLLLRMSFLAWKRFKLNTSASG